MPLVSVRVYVPAVKLKLTAFASVGLPELIVTAEAPEYEIFTVGVPVMVRFVTVPVFHAVPEVVVVMLPVPNAIVLTLEFEEAKDGVVSVLPFRSSVPAVNVTGAPNVQLLANDQVPPAPLMVRVFVPNETPPKSSVLVPLPANVQPLLAPKPKVVVADIVTLP